jgi:integrase/recombinase XerD
VFDELFEIPAFVNKYKSGPHAEPRARYLRHLKSLGACRAILRKSANDQLNLVRLLDLQDGDKVSIPRIEAAAAIWARPKGRRCKRAASLKARKRFISRGEQWLRFLGRLDEPEKARHPHGDQVDAYEAWLRSERGLSEGTIEVYCRAADRFFEWLSKNGVPLTSVKIADIDGAIAAEKARGTCGRRTVHNYAQVLRAFLRFAETRSWCRLGLAAGMMPQRFMPDESVPKGLKREDVLRLLATTEGDRPVNKRDRAILLLFIAYGLRASEVAALQLDNLDWENEILRVRHSKSGRTHSYPLSRVLGQALLRYMRDVRPSGFGRSVFFTLHAPIRPLDRRSIGKMVRDRLDRLGVAAKRRGPHALRHAAAQHLLDQGMSMKVIGDFLGHRDPSSTAIYAKVNIAALREVAALDLEGLA